MLSEWSCEECRRSGSARHPGAVAASHGSAHKDEPEQVVEHRKRPPADPQIDLGAWVHPDDRLRRGDQASRSRDDRLSLPCQCARRSRDEHRYQVHRERTPAAAKTTPRHPRRTARCARSPRPAAGVIATATATLSQATHRPNTGCGRRPARQPAPEPDSPPRSGRPAR